MGKAKPKTTPAITRAKKQVQRALARLRDYDLSEIQCCMEENRLATDHQHALATVLDALQRLAEAEALRDNGGQQQDMFAHLPDRDFAAWQHPRNQPPLL